MVEVVSTYFRITTFPHKGDIIAIDQLTLLATNSSVIGSVPLVEESPHLYQHVGFGLLKDSSIMGTFPLPPLICSTNPLGHLY